MSTKINSRLAERFKAPLEKLSKMTNLAEMTSSGHLSSFAGVFKVSSLSEKEEEMLKMLLEEFGSEAVDKEKDFVSLSAITSEVKAINNQAAILHGERIKKAQQILKQYAEGAFTFWLVHTYGNRQTPYNFLQYYELYQILPQDLLPKLDEMPRQAAYTLASREGPLEEKKKIIQEYQGETKQILLEQIRRAFPLQEKDKRAQNHGLNLIKSLTRIVDFLEEHQVKLSDTHRQKTKQLLHKLQNLIEQNKGSS